MSTNEHEDADSADPPVAPGPLADGPVEHPTGEGQASENAENDPPA